MPEVLFQSSFHAAWQNAIRSAVEDVNKLDRRLFSDPSLGGRLQAIAEKYSFDVARFSKEGVEGKAYNRERQGRDAWGDHRTISESWLDVTIPFTGDADSLRLSPSRSTVLSHRVEVGTQAVVLTIPDDQGADSKVQTFLTQANQNLDTLRAEYEQVRPQLEQAIQRAADQRKAQIATEGERDQKRSFPVRRSGSEG